MLTELEHSTECGRRDVCAVIPVHDEGVTIGRIVREIGALCRWVLVVDDGSRDDSAREAAVAGAIVLRHARRRGKGASLRTAIDRVLAATSAPSVIVDRWCHCRGVLLLDGDGQHLAREAERLLGAAERGAPLVVGDRSAMDSAMAWHRRWTNRTMTALLRPLTTPVLRDSQCGYRYLDLALCRRLRLSCDHYEAESEMLVEAHRLGADVEHVPVSVVPADGRSKIRPLRDTIRFLRWYAGAILDAHASGSTTPNPDSLRRQAGAPA